MSYNIAIDGPAGAGKSTIAKRVSAELSFIYVDTGAMYRAIALYLLKNAIQPEDLDSVKHALGEIEIAIRYVGGEQHVLLNGEDVSGQIRTEEVGNMASKSSALPCVREKLLELQQKLAREHDVVMDGRDIGTTILPDAEVKIYLTASSLTRARRRYLELQEKGIDCNLEEIQKDIEERDERDMNRAVSPLKQAKDAVLVDSSDMTIEQVVSCILEIYHSRVSE